MTGLLYLAPGVIHLLFYGQTCHIKLYEIQLQYE